MRKTLGLLLALMLFLTACGGDGGLSAEEQAKADEIKAELVADQSAENPFAEEEAAACFSEGIVGELGLDRINELDTGGGVEAGFTNMTAAEQEMVADLALGCIDFPAYMSEQLAGAGLTEEQANCVAEGLDDDLVKQLFLAQISGADVTTNDELMSVIMGCLLG